MRAHRFIVFLLAAPLAAVSPAEAQSFYITPDVPTLSGAVTLMPSDVFRFDGGVYTLHLALPPGTAIDAIHRMDSGHWLFSVDAPTTLGGTTYGPEDIVRFDGVGFSLFFSGAAAGVPAGSNIDAAFLLDNDFGSLVVSFEAPTTIGMNTYDPADLVRFFSGNISLFFDASATVPRPPEGANVTGADREGGVLFLTFEDPTIIGGVLYRSWHIVSWNGSAWSLYYADPMWPLGSRVNGLSLLANPGTVPDITVEHSSFQPGDLKISWSPSCSVGADGYGIYEGQIGLWYSHLRIDCQDDDSDLVEEITPSPGRALYYLVVPHNNMAFGSFGADSNGVQRPAGSPSCPGTQKVTPCP